jgi:flagellar basal body-associated protein FliL
MESPKKAIIFIIVGLLILSLILFYFPFTLSQPALEQKQAKQPQTQEDEIQPPVLELEPEIPTPVDGFSGLEDESKSLEELEDLLEGF